MLKELFWFLLNFAIMFTGVILTFDTISRFDGWVWIGVAALMNLSGQVYGCIKGASKD